MLSPFRKGASFALVALSINAQQLGLTGFPQQQLPDLEGETEEEGGGDFKGSVGGQGVVRLGGPGAAGEGPGCAG